MRILVEDSFCTAEFYASCSYEALLFHLLFLSFPLPFPFSSSVYSTSLKYNYSSSLSSSKCSALYECYCYRNVQAWIPHSYRIRNVAYWTCLLGQQALCGVENVAGFKDQVTLISLYYCHVAMNWVRCCGVNWLCVQNGNSMCQKREIHRKAQI